MPSRCVVLVVLSFLLGTSAAPMPANAGNARPRLDVDPDFARHLRAVLEEGRQPKADLSQAARHVDAARRLRPDDPSVDYAYGLVLQERLRYDEAAARFHAALRHDPAELRAWKALLRLRLLRRNTPKLLSESLELAESVNDLEVFWSGEMRRQLAAAWLGRMAAYLALPGVELVEPKMLSDHEASLQARLGPRFALAYEEGKETLKRDYQRLRAEIDQRIDERKRQRRQRAAQELTDIKGRKQRLQKKTETVQLTAEQQKSRLQDQLQAADKRLATLQKDYKALEATARGVSQLMTNTQISIGRLETELSLRGIRGALAARQPSMLQLQQELLRYQSQYTELQQRAARVAAQARAVLAARSAAIQRHRKVAGDLLRKDETLERWNRMLDQSSLAVKEKRDSSRPQNRLKRRLTLATSYFALDYASEAAWIWNRYGMVASTE